MRLRNAGGSGWFFVEHYGDLAIARLSNNLNVQPDKCAQPLLRIGDAAHRIDYAAPA